MSSLDSRYRTKKEITSTAPDENLDISTPEVSLDSDGTADAVPKLNATRIKRGNRPAVLRSMKPKRMY